MSCPFPGMDPYLEHPTLWPGVHNGLIADAATRLGTTTPSALLHRSRGARVCHRARSASVYWAP